MKKAFRVRRDPRGEVPAGAVAFRVATWNIHRCVGTDARFAPERVAAVIASLDVDIIGLQEVGWYYGDENGVDQFAYLAEATGLVLYPALVKDHTHARFGNALLTRLPVEQVDALDVSQPLHTPRGGLMAVLRLSEKIRVRVVVAHLGLDPWERGRQCAQILASIDAADAGEEAPIPTLFMGDFNEWRRAAPRLRRLWSRFPDAAAPRSFHSRLPTFPLDRILAAPPLKILAFDVLRNDLTRQASDHLPVRATVCVQI